MHLCIEGALKIAYRKIEMFHLPSHSMAFFALLDVSKFTKRPATCSKNVSVLKLAVEVVDKQGDYPPFFVIKSGEEGVDAKNRKMKLHLSPRPLGGMSTSPEVEHPMTHHLGYEFAADVP